MLPYRSLAEIWRGPTKFSRRWYGVVTIAEGLFALESSSQGVLAEVRVGQVRITGATLRLGLGVRLTVPGAGTFWVRPGFACTRFDRKAAEERLLAALLAARTEPVPSLR